MGKVVILRVDDNVDGGYRVTLEIGEDGQSRWSADTGKLPPNPEIFELYKTWQATYNVLRSRYRLEFEEVNNDTSASRLTGVNKSSCEIFNTQLYQKLNNWLDSKEFRSIKNSLQTELDISDEVRVIIQTDDKKLWRLPWIAWDVFDKFSKAGLALSPIKNRPIARPVQKQPGEKIRILAILGNRSNINIEPDKRLIESLPNTDTLFLDEPQRRDFEQLWDKSWDILFFAGHSRTENETGIIYFNKTESLTIGELKYTLRRTIEKGLKLAIFNSCDGLGLAHQLASWDIPQVIVMREPVPDLVAQQFLKYFLKSFSSGRTLYASVRDAQAKLRELQNLEKQFPGGSWLPVICQNLAEMPPTWQQLGGIGQGEKSYWEVVREFLPSNFDLLDDKFFESRKRGEAQKLGLPATWALIAKGDYIERSQQKQALALAKELAEFDGISLLLIRGEPGAGKTALMQWLAYELSRIERTVLQKKPRRNDYYWLEPLGEFSEQIGDRHFYLIADDLFRDDTILDELERNDLPFPLTLIGTTRFNEDKHDIVRRRGYRIEYLDLELSLADQEGILAKVCQHNPYVAAKLDKMTAAERQQLMSVPSMLVLMLQLSEGQDFDSFIADFIKRLPSGKNYPVYQVFGVICSFYQYRIATPPEVLPLCLPQYPKKAVQAVVDLALNVELKGLVKKDELDQLSTLHEKIAQQALSVRYHRRQGEENLPYSPNCLEEHLTAAIKAIDATKETHRSWAYNCLQLLAVDGQDNLVRKILHAYPAQIQSLQQQGSGVQEKNILATIYEAVGLIAERDRQRAAILSNPPTIPQEWGDWLSIIEKLGSKEQKQQAIASTTTWLQKYPLDTTVRAKYLGLIERHGTPEQKQQAIASTTTWLEKYPLDTTVRTRYLILIEQFGTPQQKQVAIASTTTWLEKYPLDTGIRTKYLGLIQRYGTHTQQQQAIAQTTTWLKKYPDDTTVRTKYLALIEQCGTPQDKQQAIAQTSNWLMQYPENTTVRTKYLGLIEQCGTPEQKQAAIDQTNIWLQNNLEDTSVRTKYLVLIERYGTPQQQQRALGQTNIWLQNHPEDTSIRTKFLGLIERCWTTQQQQRAIDQTNIWLQNHPEDTSVRAKYLGLVEQCATPQQKQVALDSTAIWLQHHPGDSLVREKYTALIERNITPEQKQTAITKLTIGLQERPNDINARRSYLTGIEQGGTAEQQRDAIAQTASWLQQHPEDTDVRRNYLFLVRKAAKDISDIETIISNQLQWFSQQQRIDKSLWTAFLDILHYHAKLKSELIPVLQKAINITLDSYPEIQDIVFKVFGDFRDYLNRTTCYRLADLISQYPFNVPAYYRAQFIHAANLFRDYHELDKAEKLYRKVLNTANSWAKKQGANIKELNGLINFASLNYARLLILRKPPMPNTAIEYLEPILKETPNHAVAHLYMAQCYQAKGRTFDTQAINSFQKAIELDNQKTGNFWYEFGCFYRDARGNRKEARKCFEKSLEQKINLRACVELADLKVQEGNFALAKEILQQGCNLVRTNRPEREHRGQLEPRIQAIQKAIKANLGS